VLDGVKTGKTILPERYKEDRESRQYGTQFVPWWKMDPDYKTQQYNLSRGDLPPFVMDLLKEAMDKAGEEQLRRIANHFAELPKIKDADLVVPWEGAEARAQEMLSRSEEQMRAIGQAQKDALEAIKTHVARVYDLNTTVMRAAMKTTALAERSAGSSAGTSRGTATVMGTQTEKSRGKQRSRTSTSTSTSASSRRRRGGSGGGSSVTFTNWSIETRQDQLRRMSREFVGGPPAEQTLVFSAEEVARLRASYAYVHDWACRPGGSRFPWNVAMRELGEIKLRARQDFKPISQDFYEKMSMRKL
jgi:RNA-dependent RNA polymerase